MTVPVRVGEVRPSQVMHTFGIGSLVDLPNISVMVLGLQAWEPPRLENRIEEKRLLDLVQSHVGQQVKYLVAPPATDDDSFSNDPFDPARLRGVPVAPFPNWVRCPLCDLIAPLDVGLFELKANPFRPDKTSFVHTNCSKKGRGRPPTVVPVRFVKACEKGHVDDFPWVEFVHADVGGPCASPRLRLYEFGVSAEAADIRVKCEGCGVSRVMALAFGDEDGAPRLGPCSRRHPHTGAIDTNCDAEAKAMLAGASNIWFPVNVSLLTIPTGGDELKALIEEHWTTALQQIPSLEVLTYARATNADLEVFARWSDQELFDAIEAKRNAEKGGDEETTPIGVHELKRQEWEVFSRPSDVSTTRDLQLDERGPPKGYENVLERVVLLKRLREVSAMIGFTRIVSPGDYADIDEIPNRAPISPGSMQWVPAAEMRGEGIFIQFDERMLVDWEGRSEIKQRESVFRAAHTAFRSARRIDNPAANFPGMRYVLLHTLSHALIRQFSIECGYGAASLRERIYADLDTPMAGILLYTAAPDSEGTLGGLVRLGEPEHLVRHLDQALEELGLCASDPLCAEHQPDDDTLTLHGAACHACLFASETSCERSNKYLDRTLLVETLGRSEKPFFETLL